MIGIDQINPTFHPELLSNSQARRMVGRNKLTNPYEECEFKQRDNHALSPMQASTN